MKSTKIIVEHTKLGKQRIWGDADNNIIRIDSRLKGKKHLEIMIHEALHILHPRMSEEKVVKNSVILCNLLWEHDYRRVENTNTIHLQDGTI